MAEKIQSDIYYGQAVDDFKQLDGIGPAVEKRLHTAGILTFAQLARLKPEKLAKHLNGMVGYSSKRIEEQNWNGQAFTLAEEKKFTPASGYHDPINNSLHYASYTVELLLDRENQVRRTRALHVQSNQEITWAGWDMGRLRSFFVDNGHLQITPVQEDGSISKPTHSPHSNRESSHQAPILQGNTKIVETRLMNEAGSPLGTLIPSNTPFEVHMLLDLSQVEVPKGERLDYNATLYMKEMGKSGREVTGEKNGSLEKANRTMIDVCNQPLAVGDYRLDVLLTLRPKSQPKQLRNQLTAMTESIVVHVF